MLKNKRANLAVTLLVLMSIVVAGAASLIFVISSGRLGAGIVDARFIDEVYLREGELDFYINEIIEGAIERTEGSENFKQDFIINFKEGLGKYKEEGRYVIDEFIQIEQQIDLRGDEIVEYEKSDEGGRISIDFKSIEIGTKTQNFNVIYTYDRKFEKNF